jgi:3-oxoacyl-[acyl-carrier-protein] synthase I
MSRRVVITGVGLITPIGNDEAAVLASLRALRHGFAPVEFHGNPRLPVKLAGRLKEFAVASTQWRDWRWPARYAIPPEALRSLPPHGLYALCAIEQAVAAAGLAAAALRDGATGLFCASAGSTFLLHHHLTQLAATRGERGSPLGVVASIAGTLNFNLAAHYGVRGAVTGFSSACASSGHALGYACDEIRLGRHRRMVVVGAEEATAESVLPFAAMRALSTQAEPAQASRPFDVARDGFVCAEGAVALVLEDADEARARGALTLAEIVGWGQASDGHSPAISHPEGAGLREAMRRALADAGLAPEEIDYINAHGTSTPVGDRAEALALRAVFTAVGATPPVSSTKALTGHGLSMSAAMEVAFVALCLREQFVPGCAHLTTPDPACDGLNLPRVTQAARLRHVLTNCSGFGGSNVCHVLRRG